MLRRTFLRLGVGTAALAASPAVFRRNPATAQPAAGPFGHGVASGDPVHDRVILWTRVTPSPEATPGSGLGAPTPVRWEVADDDTFASIVASGEELTDPDRDHTVKVDATGLEPLTTYAFRFHALEATSPVGRTRTAPAPGAAVDLLRFGVVSCSNWEGGYFSAYRHVAERDDLDWVLHLGDYLYEYGVGGYGPGETFGRVHDPADEMVSLEDYRRRHALYKTDPDLQALHGRYAFISTIDDHEVTNNSWADGAENHTDGSEGDYHERRAAAFKAYFEWMPLRVTGGPDGEPARLWRQLPFGGLADLFMLDERTYRSVQPAGLSGDLFVTSAEPDDPGRTMLGPEQLEFLTDGLHQSTATWKLLGNGVMFAPLVLADVPDVLSDLVPTLVPQAGVPVVLNGDQWDGYRFEQRTVNDLFGEVGGVVLLTGDIHSSWAAEIPADPSTYLAVVGGVSNAVEFVTPAVTSDSFTAAVESAGIPNADQVAVVLPTVATTAGPWFKYLEPDRHGYGVFEVTPAHVQYDWHHISDRTDPAATEAFAVGFESPVGTNRLLPASELGPRPATPVPVPVAIPAPAPVTVAPGTGAGTLPATGASPSAAGLAAAGVAAALAAAAARRRAMSEDGGP